MAEERELKLEFHNGDAARLKRSILFGSHKGHSCETLTSVYFDTPKQRLRRDGFTLRVRHKNDGYVQTLKSNDPTSIGTHVRAEWEWPVASAKPDLSLLADTPLAERAARPRFAAKLAPLFETRVKRTVNVIVHDGATVEVALDVGTVVAGNRSAPIRSLELELKSGPAEALYGLATQMPKGAILDLDVRSKSERGFALLNDEPEVVHKAEPIDIGEDVDVVTAARIVLKSCLRQFHLNLPGVVVASDPEALHQARVAIRRCRSALSFFEPVLHDPGFEQHKDKLRSLSRALGHARDLDVFLADDTTATSPDVRDKARAERDRRYANLHFLLVSQDHRTAMLAMLAWIEHGSWGRGDRGEAAVSSAAFAGSRLERLRRKLRKKGPDLTALSDHERHKIRIKAKTLRYACEFHASTVSSKPARRRHATFVAALETLQMELGLLNDAVFGHALTEALGVRDAYKANHVGSPAPGHEPTVGVQPATIKRAGRAFRAFRTAKPPWA